MNRRQSLEEGLLKYDGDRREVILTMDDLSYFVKEKQVLFNVSAQFKPNQLVALMGIYFFLFLSFATS